MQPRCDDAEAAFANALIIEGMQGVTLAQIAQDALRVYRIAGRQWFET